MLDPILCYSHLSFLVPGECKIPHWWVVAFFYGLGQSCPHDSWSHFWVELNTRVISSHCYTMCARITINLNMNLTSLWFIRISISPENYLFSLKDFLQIIEISFWGKGNYLIYHKKSIFQRIRGIRDGIYSPNGAMMSKKLKNKELTTSPMKL